MTLARYVRRLPTQKEKNALACVRSMTVWRARADPPKLLCMMTCSDLPHSASGPPRSPAVPVARLAPVRIRWRRPRASSSAAWRSASIGRSCGSPRRRSPRRTRARALGVRETMSGGRPRTSTRATPTRPPPRSTRRPGTPRSSRRAQFWTAMRRTRTRPRRRRPRRACVSTRFCGTSRSAWCPLPATRTRRRRTRRSGTEREITPPRLRMKLKCASTLWTPMLSVCLWRF